jgi:hypothetical protein
VPHACTLLTTWCCHPLIHATDRINSNTVHAVLRRPPPAYQPAPSASGLLNAREEPSEETEEAASARLMSDIKAALALEDGSTRDKQQELERRIAVIERSIGINNLQKKKGDAAARMKIATLQRQLSLARTAVQSVIQSEQDGAVLASQLTSRDIKLRSCPYI